MTGAGIGREETVTRQCDSLNTLRSTRDIEDQTTIGRREGPQEEEFRGKG